VPLFAPFTFSCSFLRTTILRLQPITHMRQRQKTLRKPLLQSSSKLPSAQPCYSLSWKDLHGTDSTNPGRCGTWCSINAKQHSLLTVLDVSSHIPTIAWDCHTVIFDEVRSLRLSQPSGWEPHGGNASQGKKRYPNRSAPADHRPNGWCAHYLSKN